MAVRVPMAGGHFALVDDADAERVLALRWYRQHRYAVNGRGGSKPTLGGRIYLHRFILNAPDGVLVDHINGDGLDCRRENLRLADHSLNALNRQYRNSTQFRGVSKGRTGWDAAVSVRGQRFVTRRHDSPEAAARAYDELATRHWGDAARLNFPTGARA